jgi:hypothetical protein
MSMSNADIRVDIPDPAGPPPAEALPSLIVEVPEGTPPPKGAVALGDNGETLSPLQEQARKNQAAKAGSAPAAGAAPSDATVTPPTPDGAAPAPAAEPTDLEKAKAAADRAIAKARATARQRRENERAQADRTRLEQETQRLRSEQQDVDGLRRLRAQLQSGDPAQRLAAARALGYQTDEMARIAIEENTPEGRIRLAEAKAAEAQRRVDEMQKRIDFDRATADRQSLEQRFLAKSVKTVVPRGHTEAVPLYPNLVAMPPAHVLALGRSLYERAAERYGQERANSFTHEEILGALEQEQASHQRKTAHVRPALKTPLAPAGATAKASQPTPRVPSSADKSDVITPPKSIDDMDDVEQKRYLTAILRKARRTEE